MGNTEAVAEQHYVQEMKDFRSLVATQPTMPGKVPKKLPTLLAETSVAQRQSVMSNRTPTSDFTGESNEFAGGLPRRSGSGWESNPPGTG